MKIKLVSIIGTRPQIIKAAALHRCIQLNYKTQLQEVIIYTGQHFSEDLSLNLLKELDLPNPHYHFELTSKNREDRIEEMNTKCQEVLDKVKPDYVIAYGDTDTTLSATKAAVAQDIALIHIEAGMRSYNEEMPEEFNRIYCDQNAKLHFTASHVANRNLISEGISAPLFVGDVMYDNYLHYNKIAKADMLDKLKINDQAFGLITIHRNYNTDQLKKFVSILESLNHYTQENKFHCIFPVHPRTKSKLESSVFEKQFNLLRSNPFLHITAPLPYLEMIALVRRCELILTDSGGLQKEAYYAQKPCVILRPETEWTEILETGSAKLAHGSYRQILESIQKMHAKKDLNFPSLFGEGNAANMICDEIIKNHLAKKS